MIDDTEKLRRFVEALEAFEQAIRSGAENVEPQFSTVVALYIAKAT